MAATVLFSIGSTAVTLGHVMSVGSTVLSAASAMNQHNAQIGVARYNAAIAQQDAQRESERRSAEGQRQVASIRAARAKSGVAMQGSPLLATIESMGQVELDAMNAQLTGANESRLYRQQARSYKQARTTSVGTSLLRGATNLIKMG